MTAAPSSLPAELDRLAHGQAGIDDRLADRLSQLANMARAIEAELAARRAEAAGASR